MPTQRAKKFCDCKVFGCFNNQEINPQNDQVVRGRYLPATTWERHRDAQQEAEIEAQTESLANMTLLRTMVSKPTVASAAALPTTTPHDVTEVLNDLHITPPPIGTQRPALEIDRIKRSNADLLHLAAVIDQKITAFSPPRSLQFASSPTTFIPYTSQFTTSPPSNTGIFSLTPRHAANSALMEYERWLVQVLSAVDDIETHHDTLLVAKRNVYMEKIHQELQRLDSVKKSEWERQYTAQGLDQTAEDPPHRVDTHTYLGLALQDLESIPLICVFVVTVLNVLCHVSREPCNFVLFSLRYLVSLILNRDIAENPWRDKKILSSIPLDVRTARTHFEIEPKLITYVCCPRCCALYAPDAVGQASAYPETCQSRDPLGNKSCGARLRKTRYIHGQAYTIPVRTYLYQDFRTWLARLICRPGMEALLDRPICSEASPGDIYHDIWDGHAVRDFVGRDGKPFFQYSGPDARLLFGLSYDNFNPFHNKAAGKVVSVGAIFAVCYNLPQEIRFRHENIYLAGVVPGPKAPTLTQTNHFIRPLIDDFKTFWSPGFLFSKTPLRKEGRLAQGALIPLIMDLHALRQICGAGAFNSRNFCTFCMLLHRDIDNVDPLSWPPVRSCAEHRDLAEAWKNATTEKERDELFEEFSLRWSELLRLPYYKPHIAMVVDTLHAWFLNDFKTLVRSIWGVDHEKPSGDGLFVSKRPKSKFPIAPKELVNALNALAIDDQVTLKKVRKIVLYHLCEARGLRRSNTCYQMILVLKAHYDSNRSHLQSDISAALKATPEQFTDSSRDQSTTRTRLFAATEATRIVDITWLGARRKGDLQQLCSERGIVYTEKETRKDLADKLVDNQIQHQFRPNAQKLLAQKPTAVIGADMVKEINSDLARTVLPSWAASGPASFDSSNHGKPSGDEWRTIVLIRLVITLPRVWGPQGGRRRLMLENFMHLVNAVTIGSSRSIIARPSSENGATKSTATLYREEYQAYLKGRVELYPTGKITPTEHISYHIGDKLEEYGPIHSWRVNAFERYNGMLQNTNMNMRFGELEGTFMRAFCMGANLKALVGDPRIPDPIQNLRKKFQMTFGSNDQGGLLRDLLASEDYTSSPLSDEELERLPRINLREEVAKLLVESLNSEDPNPGNYVTGDHRRTGIRIDPTAWPLSEYQYRGIWYRKARPTETPLQSEGRFVPHRDSHVLIRRKIHSRPIPCAIHNIFAHRHLTSGCAERVVETYLVVREYKEMTTNHKDHDPWRAFPTAGGRLYYDTLEDQAKVVNIRNVVGQFAKTAYSAGEIPGIDEPCVHVLPLTWHQTFDCISPEHLVD